MPGKGTREVKKKGPNSIFTMIIGKTFTYCFIFGHLLRCSMNLGKMLHQNHW